MRAVVVAIVVLAARTVIAGPPMRALGDRHFDHAAHATAVNGVAVPCARCHPTTGTAGQLTDTGKSAAVDHALCSGSGCHGTSFAKDTRCDAIKAQHLENVCAVCHIKDTCFLAPPASVDHMQSGFAHGRHSALGPAIEPDCALCHTAEAGAPAADGHRACAACHEHGLTPAMTDCATCHRGGVVLPGPGGDLKFSHDTHAVASKQRACLSCHATPASPAPDAKIPPTMLGCQTTCHDGQHAFSTTGTTCTRCHAAAGPAQPTSLAQPFSHAAHAALHVAIDNCAACHALAADGQLLAPGTGKDHQPCAASGCHQAEFASKTPSICGVCHDAVAPGQKAVARASTASAKVEWFTGINHASHSRSTCEQCHTGATLAVRGHADCAPCHDKAQQPAMTACAGCHASTAPARAPASVWSVAATFQHATHVEDPRSHGKTSCVECHASVATATDLASIRAPAMPTCDGCHDGAHAFKSTGFQCARCHTKAVP